MLKITTICLVLLAFFYPIDVSWFFIIFFVIFEGYLLLLDLRGKKIKISNKINFTEEEKIIIKRYHLYFRYPFTAKSFSTTLSLIALSGIPLSIWFLFNGLWPQAIIIGINIWISGMLSSKLNTRFFLHDAVERRGMEEFRNEMILVDSICNKITNKSKNE